MTTPVPLGVAAAAAQARQELEYVIEEYQFMRSFGMTYERAAAAIGHHPEVLRRRFERNNLTHLI